MKQSSKFSDVLHVLLHMAESETFMRSEQLARSMNTNPVVVRRLMAGLRERGFVRSVKGHGGGWQLSCDLNEITLYDVYRAVDSPTLLAMTNRNPNPDCKVEEAVNVTTDGIFGAAEELLLERFRGVSLSVLRDTVRDRIHGQDQDASPGHHRRD